LQIANKIDEPIWELYPIVEKLIDSGVLKVT